MTDAKEYKGEEKIAISIDVGTTSSGPIQLTLTITLMLTSTLHVGAASYVYFYPGSRPEVRMVSVTDVNGRSCSRAAAVRLLRGTHAVPQQVTKWPGQPAIMGDSKVRNNATTTETMHPPVSLDPHYSGL
jgi:hypothetical protein